MCAGAPSLVAARVVVGSVNLLGELKVLAGQGANAVRGEPNSQPLVLKQKVWMVVRALCQAANLDNQGQRSPEGGETILPDNLLAIPPPAWMG